MACKGAPPAYDDPVRKVLFTTRTGVLSPEESVWVGAQLRPQCGSVCVGGDPEVATCVSLGGLKPTVA